MNKIAKAVIAAVTAGAGALATAQADGNITGTEWGVIVVAALVAGFGVWATPNAPATTTVTLSPPQGPPA